MSTPCLILAELKVLLCVPNCTYVNISGACMVKRFHAIITGKVQGVFFRVSAREQAKALDIKGFVRNLPDGSVELDAEGEEETLSDLLQWCQHGPPSAWVENVNVDWRKPSGSYSDFLITD